jgi:cell division protein FtsX
VSKTQAISETKSEGKVSVCDIMKTNTSKIIQKFESQIPSRFQQYSDLYTAYLHTIDDVYGTCFISEKEFFDKLNIDQGVLHSIQEYAKSLTDAYLVQIDLYAKSREEFVQTQISSLKVYDNFMHTMMDSYAKTLSQLNKVGDSFNK